MINKQCLAWYLKSNVIVSMRMYWMEEESIFYIIFNYKTGAHQTGMY